MIDLYSASVGFGLCLLVWGVFAWGRLYRDKEIREMHEANIDFGKYYAETDRRQPSWFPRRSA